MAPESMPPLPLPPSVYSEHQWSAHVPCPSPAQTRHGSPSPTDEMPTSVCRPAVDTSTSPPTTLFFTCSSPAGLPEVPPTSRAGPPTQGHCTSCSLYLKHCSPREAPPYLLESLLKRLLTKEIPQLSYWYCEKTPHHSTHSLSFYFIFRSRYTLQYNLGFTHFIYLWSVSPQLI